VPWRARVGHTRFSCAGAVPTGIRLPTREALGWHQAQAVLALSGTYRRDDLRAALERAAYRRESPSEPGQSLPLDEVANVRAAYNQAARQRFLRAAVNPYSGRRMCDAGRPSCRVPADSLVQVSDPRATPKTYLSPPPAWQSRRDSPTL
jgi:hypothetical protein